MSESIKTRFFGCIAYRELEEAKKSAREEAKRLRLRGLSTARSVYDLPLVDFLNSRPYLLKQLPEELKSTPSVNSHTHDLCNLLEYTRKLKHYFVINGATCVGLRGCKSCKIRDDAGCKINVFVDVTRRVSGVLLKALHVDAPAWPFKNKEYVSNEVHKIMQLSARIEQGVDSALRDKDANILEKLADDIAAFDNAVDEWVRKHI